MLLAAIGVLGGAGQILMTHSYRFADASVIAAFDYVAMIWAAALGYALFAETPSPRHRVGGGGRRGRRRLRALARALGAAHPPGRRAAATVETTRTA